MVEGNFNQRGFDSLMRSRSIANSESVLLAKQGQAPASLEKTYAFSSCANAVEAFVMLTQTHRMFTGSCPQTQTRRFHFISIPESETY